MLSPGGQGSGVASGAFNIHSIWATLSAFRIHSVYNPNNHKHGKPVAFLSALTTPPDPHTQQPAGPCVRFTLTPSVPLVPCLPDFVVP
mmetsp:Transcript_98308/g.169410  ORF Transcript_98308/g.169410 Transcript_98308/m.169410 type:complete len:88 (-) Transcript_98308:379-642(-)